MRGRGRGRGRQRNDYHHSPSAAAAAAAAAYMYGTAFYGAPHAPNNPNLPPFLPHLMPAPNYLHHRHHSHSARRRPRGRGRGQRAISSSYARGGYHANFRYHSATVPVNKKENIACKYHTRGRCNNGKACLYTHEHRAACTAYLSGKGACQGEEYDDEEYDECEEGTHVLNQYNTPECERHLGNVCHLGKHCPFRHTETNAATDVQNNRNSDVCRYFADSGVCIKGAQCPWLHTEYCREIDADKGCSTPKCHLRHASLLARIQSQQALWKHHRNKMRMVENGNKNEETLAMDSDAYIDRDGDIGFAYPQDAAVKQGGRADDGYLSLHVTRDEDEYEEDGEVENNRIKRRAHVVKKEEDEEEEVVFVKENLVSNSNRNSNTNNDESEGEIAEGSEGEIDSQADTEAPPTPSPLRPSQMMPSTCPF